MQTLKEIFEELKMVLSKYNPPLVSHRDTENDYDLWTNSPVIINGRNMKELYLAAVSIKSNFVGFYFMPIYMNPPMLKLISPRLLKLLKGKSCFHIKTINDELLNDIRTTLELGIKFYKEEAWKK